MDAQNQQDDNRGSRFPNQPCSAKSCWRKNATALIGVAIILVLCIHWHMAIVHTQDFRPHDLFLSSFSSSRSTRDDEIASSARRGEKASMDTQSLVSNRDGVSPYILSPLCGGCYRSMFDSRSCFTIMRRDVQKRKMTLMDAANKLGNESKACRLCNPLQCWMHYFNNSTQHYGSGHQSKYWRFDKSHPKFTNPTTLMLTSIPSELRMPASRFQDIGAYFQEKYKISLETDSSMDLVEYNPGLVVIPTEMKQYLPKEAAYLLSLRVTPANNCFSSEVYADLPKDVWKAVYYTSTNHLGLALLDEKYQMMPGYDVVIEIDAPLGLKRDTTSKAGKSVSPTFMDYRIFALNNEIYLHANADTVVVTRISIRAKGFGDDDAYMRDTRTCATVAEEAGNKGNWEESCRLENLFGGDNLQVALMHQFNTIWSGGSSGKNYALFGVPNATHPTAPDTIYAELDIFPHHVQQIVPDEFNQFSKQDVFDRIWKPGTLKSRRVRLDLVNMRMMKEVGNITESGKSPLAPLPSFSTVDAHSDWFPGEQAPFKEAAHGGACCVSLSVDEINLGGTHNNHHESLLVGIGHTKVVWKPWYSKKNVPQEEKDRVPHTHYVSLFYAFDPYPPFRIRVRSGYFCLGHVPLATSDKLPPSEGGVFNPRYILTRNRELQQNNITFACPQMAFVSSFTQKAGDSSKTVIGYGLNDCTGRLVEVEKSEIVRLLYPDPMDMIFD